MPQFQSRTKLDPKYGAEGNRANLEDTFAMMNKVIQQAQGPVNIPFPKGTPTLGGQQLMESARQHAATMTLEQERENRLRQQGMMPGVGGGGGGGVASPEPLDMLTAYKNAASVDVAQVWQDWIDEQKLDTAYPDPVMAEGWINETAMPRLRSALYADAGTYGLSGNDIEDMLWDFEMRLRAWAGLRTTTKEQYEEGRKRYIQDYDPLKPQKYSDEYWDVIDPLRRLRPKPPAADGKQTSSGIQGWFGNPNMK